MGMVIADQSKATGISSHTISSVEIGAVGVPSGYIDKLCEWMELDQLEKMQLRNLAAQRPKKTRDWDDQSLIDILNNRQFSE